LTHAAFVRRPAGCGKTTLWRVLQRALGRLGTPPHVHIMNPKAMPRSQLLGHLDLDTRKWYDGVLTASARQVVRAGDGAASWVLCDGDVDPEWVESLNSVLDDNRLLTLPSGERIQFPATMPVNFVFETDDLSFASPATVSRMAVIFLSDEDLDAGRLARAWVRAQPEDRQLSLGAWADEFLERALTWLTERTSSGNGSEAGARSQGS